MNLPNDPDPEYVRQLVEEMDGRCYSVWEGHACHQEKDHLGHHICGDAGCVNITWTDGQAKAWMAEVRKEIRDMTSGSES